MLKQIDYQGSLEEVANKFQGRKAEVSEEVNKSVQEIVNAIRKEGDSALFSYAKKFDGYNADKNNLLVTRKEREEGLEKIDENYFRILRRTKSQIEEFHKHQLGNSWSIYKENGVIMGQIARPLERVALYVPGGTAAYPSTVIMNAVPALLAGVKEIIMITPVKADGQVNTNILAAAEVCGIETIYKVGGAQAVAAVAYGTDSIPKVDKIVGPGNIFVATAKKICYGMVDIDMIAGPSEVLVIADEKANPKYIAADLMAQAEHDKLASAILVTTSESLVQKVDEELEKQVQSLESREIIESSVSNYGGAIVVKSIDEAFEVSNQLAPEHLEVLTTDPLAQLPKIKNAGSIFLGEYTPEPLGDYMSGSNHVLPTGGTAKFYSGLGVYNFVKYSTYSYYPKEILADFQEDVVTFAKSEGMSAHANSISVRFDDEKKEK